MSFKEDLRATSEANVELMISKQNDYGPKAISDAPGGPLNGLQVRLHDKLCRLVHLIETGADPENESLRDTLKDISNYGLIGQMVLDGTWPKSSD